MIPKPPSAPTLTATSTSAKGKSAPRLLRRIVRHPKLKNIPFICETPVDKPGDDVRNIRMMRKLA